MGRQILGGPLHGHVAAPSVQTRVGQGLTGPKLQQLLRQKRSKAFIDQIGKIDASYHQHDQKALDRMIEAISAEFPDLTIDQRPRSGLWRSAILAIHLKYTFAILAAELCNTSKLVIQCRRCLSVREASLGTTEQSHLPAKHTLDQLGIARLTFYRWYEHCRLSSQFGSFSARDS